MEGVGWAVKGVEVGGWGVVGWLRWDVLWGITEQRRGAQKSMKNVQKKNEKHKIIESGVLCPKVVS